jgi:hypothetical protein
MGLDFTGNMNYQQMQHIDAGAALQNTLRGMVDDRTKSAEMAAKLARQEQDRQDTLLQRGVENTRADANLLLNQNEATRKAQQDEYTMQLKASEMGLTSDYRLADLAAKAEENKNTAAYRTAEQKYRDKAYEETIRKNQYEENKDAGEGYLFKTQGTTEEVDDTKVFDKEGAGKKYDEFTAGINKAEKAVTTGTYADYLKTTNPGYVEPTRKENANILTGEQSFFTLPRGHSKFEDTVRKRLAEGEMTQTEYEAAQKAEPKDTKIKSKSEWEREQKKNSQSTAKLPTLSSAMKNRLLTDTKYQEEQGLLKAVPGATKVTSLPNDQILSGIQNEVTQAVEDYKQTHNTDKVPSGWLSGLNKAAKNKYDSILTTKAESNKYVRGRQDKQEDSIMGYKVQAQLLKDKAGYEKQLQDIKDTSPKAKLEALKLKAQIEAIDAKLKSDSSWGPF